VAEPRKDDQAPPVLNVEFVDQPGPWDNDPIIVPANQRGMDPIFVDGPPPRGQADFGLGLRATIRLPYRSPKYCNNR